MGTTRRDIFGGAEGAQSAAAGSYGQAPSGFRLPEATRLGPVRLQVADLDRSVTFYEGVLGLRASAREPGRAVLAAHADARTLVELLERPGAASAGRGDRLGLYHYAFLLPERAELGRFAKHLAAIGVRAGAADHLVSEAFYLSDPDGLGIEVYADRPRPAWRRTGRELMLATDPLDLADLVRSAGDTPWSGMPAGTVIGHVHLHVGSIEEAAAFHSEGLGFDRMVWSYPGALFFGAGGYHHHVGTNTWAGPTARSPQDDDARLLEWTIELPDRGAVSAALRSLEGAGFAAERAGEDVVAVDPWGTPVRVRVRSER